jgi:hypothetical protein
MKLVSNKCKPDGTHDVIAQLEDVGLPTEYYRHINCDLLIPKSGVCAHCTNLRKTLLQIRRRIAEGKEPVKLIHASENVLQQTINKQRKVYKSRGRIRIDVNITLLITSLP